MVTVFSISLAVAIVAGLLLGSFLNVCIVRLPAGESILTPPSHCRSCGQRIRAADNVPLASWAMLRGKCRNCGRRISVQYPLVELATALLFVFCVVHTGTTWQTLLDAAECFLLLGLGVMDAQTMLLPDMFTLGGLLLAFAMKVLEPGLHDRVQVAWRTLADAVLAGAILLAVSLLYRAVRGRMGIGMGDVKLVAMMAGFAGLAQTLLACFAGVLGAAGFALYLITRRQASAFDRLPFGSFLAAAGIFAIFAGKPVLAWYLGLFHR